MASSLKSLRFPSAEQKSVADLSEVDDPHDSWKVSDLKLWMRQQRPLALVRSAAAAPRMAMSVQKKRAK